MFFLKIKCEICKAFVTDEAHNLKCNSKESCDKKKLESAHEAIPHTATAGMLKFTVFISCTVDMIAHFQLNNHMENDPAVLCSRG